jgi:hypothetical protein
VAGRPRSCTLVRWMRALTGDAVPSSVRLILLVVRCTKGVLAVLCCPRLRAPRCRVRLSRIWHGSLCDAGPRGGGGGASLCHQAGSGAAPRVTGPCRGCFITQSGSVGTLRGFVTPWLLPVGLLASGGLLTSGRRAALGCRSAGLWSWPC